MLGYKVMRYDRGQAVSGADSRQRFRLRRGQVVRMYGAGLYLGLIKEYVVKNYACHDRNVLITFEFDPKAIKKGNLTDREPEFSVPSAKIVNYEVLDSED